MSASVFDGNALASAIRGETARRVRALAEQGISVRLDAIMVGEPPAGRIFTQSQENRCREAGIAYHLHALPADATQAEIEDTIHRLNADSAVTGILLNLPLPDGIDTPAIQYCIDPYKDIEGVNPVNIGMLFYDSPIMAPCTALAVLEVLKHLGCAIRGRHAVVVGMGRITGRPIILNLMQQDATVTACNVYTAELAQQTRHADLLIATAGVPGLIGREHVKRGAIVIDVGINRVPLRPGSNETCTVGDVRFDEVRDVASVITPVPGGVGPVTVSIVLRSAIEAVLRQRGPRRIGR